MILSMTGQARLFLFTVALGFSAGFVYDIFRILRKTFKHPDILTQLEDLLYWLLISLLVFYFMLNRNYGEIRVFSVMGLFIGMTLYFCTLSIVVFNVSVSAVNFIKKAVRLIFNIVMTPFRLVLRLFAALFRVLGGWLGPIFTNAKKRTKSGLNAAQRYAKIKAAGAARDIRIIRKRI